MVFFNILEVLGENETFSNPLNVPEGMFEAWLLLSLKRIFKLLLSKSQGLFFKLLKEFFLALSSDSKATKEILLRPF